MAAAGLRLRPAKTRDLAALSELYAQMRAPELAPVPWSPERKAAFLASQFALQHRHFTQTDPASDFWIVERDGVLAGRLYADRKGRAWRLPEIMLAAAARGQGCGTALIRWLQADALSAGARTVDLHVLIANPRVGALYARLGFVDVETDSPTHRGMRWTAEPAA